MPLLTVSHSDGHQSTLQFIGNQSAENVILILPAMGVKAAYYQRFAEGLLENNLAIALIDLRGQGTSTVRASRDVDWGFKQHLEDIDNTIQLIKEKFHNPRCWILGHSLGGQLGCLYKAKYQDKIAGLILIACCSIYYKGWEGNGLLKIKISYQVVGLVSKILGYFPGKKFRFSGLQSRTEIRDWAFNAANGYYSIQNESYDFQDSMKAIRPNILAFTLEGDWMAPFLACQYLLNMFHSESNIDHKTIDASGSQGKSLTHFSWTKYPQLFKQDILNRIEQN